MHVVFQEQLSFNLFLKLLDMCMQTRAAMIIFMIIIGQIYESTTCQRHLAHEPKVMSSKVIFCPTRSPKPNDTQFTLYDEEIRAWTWSLSMCNIFSVPLLER